MNKRYLIRVRRGAFAGRLGVAQATGETWRVTFESCSIENVKSLDNCELLASLDTIATLIAASS